MMKFQITPFNSLLVTFGLTGIVEALIQTIWTADFRKLESSYGEHNFKVAGLYVPLPELITLGLAVSLSFVVWAVLRYTDLGKALRASAEDSAVAAAFGINEKRNALLLAGTCSALASIAGVCLALGFTLAPSQIYAWIGVVYRRGDAGRPGPRAGAAVRRRRHRCQRGGDDGSDGAVVGAAGLVHVADRDPAVASGASGMSAPGRSKRSSPEHAVRR